MAGVRQAVGKISVVGENEKAFTVFVQTPGTEEALFAIAGWKKLEHGPVVVAVPIGADETFGLVHREGRAIGWPVKNRSSSQRYGITSRIDAGAHGGGFTIYGDDAISDPPLGLPSGTIPLVGEKSLKFYGAGWRGHGVNRSRDAPAACLRYLVIENP